MAIIKKGCKLNVLSLTKWYLSMLGLLGYNSTPLIRYVIWPNPRYFSHWKEFSIWICCPESACAKRQYKFSSLCLCARWWLKFSVVTIEGGKIQKEGKPYRIRPGYIFRFHIYRRWYSSLKEAWFKYVASFLPVNNGS